MNAKDEFLVFNEHRCTRAFTADGVQAAMEDLGQFAQVRRITDGELSRIVTHNFQTIEPDEYDESEAWTRFHTRRNSRAVAYGRR